MNENRSEKIRNNVLENAAEHHMQFLAYAFGILGDWSAAEDVVQEAYLRIADKWETYDRDKPIFPWARSFVRNGCLEYRRARGRESATGNEVLEALIESRLEDFFSSVISQERLNEKVCELLQCFKSLSEQSKRLLYGFYVQGKNCKEIAKAEGLHAHTPVNQLSRLRRQMRQCLISRSSAKDNSEEGICQLDDFFSQSNFDSVDEEIKAIRNLSKGNSTFFLQYMEEYAVFAIALEKWKETDLSSSLFALQKGSQSNDSIKITVDSDTRMAQFPAVGEKSMRQSKPGHRWYLSGIAALFCIGISLWYHATLLDSIPIVRIVTAEGSVYAIRNSEKSKIVPGLLLNGGDSISTAENANCKIIYLNDQETTIEAEANSEVGFDDNENFKQLNIVKGDFLFDVGRQGQEDPMKIATPHATVRILGTRFRLEVTPVSTKLSLHSGRVVFRGIVDGSEHLLTKGQFAAIENGKVRKGQLLSGRFANQDLSDSLDFDENGLIALYRFEEGEGDIVSDSSSFGSKGKIDESVDLNKIWVPGYNGGSGIFFPEFGIEGRKYVRVISFKKFPADRIDRQLSMMMWIRLDLRRNLNGIENTLLSSPSTKHGAGWRFRLGYKHGQLQTSFRINFDGNENSDKNRLNQVKSDGFTSAEDWMQIGMVFDSGHLQFYVNGRPFGRVRQLGDSIIKSVPGMNVYVGSFAQPAIVHLDGIAIYNRALLDEEFE